MTSVAGAPPRAVAGDDVHAAIDRLSAALEAEAFAGWDPYDALSSPVLRAVARTPFLRRAAIQSLKRLPVNVRPLLGIPRRRHTKGLALLVSAYTLLAQREDGGRFRPHALELGRRLADRAVPAGHGMGWGYDFDVQTRWGFYRHGEPNAIVTAFTAHALLDLAALEGDEAHAALAHETLDFALSELLVERGGDSFFAYYAGSTTVVHNANLLLSSLFARSATAASSGFAAAEAAMRYSLERQHEDGSWPYGEGRGLGWVDGFHTAYVLDALAHWHRATGDADVEAALLRGLQFARTRLVASDGAPLATPEARYPIDIHAASSLIRTLSTLGRFDPAAPGVATRVLEWTLRSMRREDGRFAFQLHRTYRNSVPYIRWSDAHMMLALACYVTRDDGRV